MIELWNYVYTDELYHYGIKGMKWGVRKKAYSSTGANAKPKRGSEAYYRQKADKAIGQVSSRKTRLGKYLANEKAFKNEYKANVKSTIASNKNEKNLLKRLDNRYGHGAEVARLQAASNYWDRKSGYTKTKLGTRDAEAKAYNAQQMAKARQKMHDSRTIKEYGKNYVDMTLNRKVKTWSGRTTSTGEQFVDKMLTRGIGDFIEDVKYYTGH